MAFTSALRHALVSLRASRRVVLLVVLLVGAGAGATAAVFAVLDRIFLRPPDGVQAPSLVKRVAIHRRGRTGVLRPSTFSYPEFVDVSRAVTAFGPVAAYDLLSASPADPRSTGDYAFVSSGYFDLLRVPPAAGRLFSFPEAEPRVPASEAVISQSYWRARFGSDSGVVGSIQLIDSVRVRIVGVAGAGFRGLDAQPTDVWMPLAMKDVILAARYNEVRREGAEWSADRQDRWLSLLVRLKADKQQASVEGQAAGVVFDQRLTPNASEVAIRVESLRDDRSFVRANSLQGQKPASILVLAAITSLAALLLCFANAAAILGLRAIRRRHEFAIRRALGLSRAQLIAVTMAEAAVLATLATIVAGLVAMWTGHALWVTVMPNVAWELHGLDVRQGLFIIVATMAAASGASLLPLLSADASGQMRRLCGSANTQDGATRNLTRGLIVVEFVLCMALLGSSGVLIQSLRRTLAVRLGYEPNTLLLVTVEPQRMGTLLDALGAVGGRLASTPGVRGVALAAGTVTVGSSERFALRWSSGDTLTRSESNNVLFNAVDAHFFEVAGMRIVRGRGFADSDDISSERVAVINRAMATAYWAGKNPVGDCFYLYHDGGSCLRIVGIVDDIVRNVGEPPPARYYLPLRQPPTRSPADEPVSRASCVIARWASPVSADLPQIHRIVADATGPRSRSIREEWAMDAVDRQLHPIRSSATLVSVLAALSLALAGIGIFGALSHDVHSRSKEIALKLALGADRHEIFRSVATSLIWPALVGIPLGVLGAMIGMGLVRALLFATSPADPAALGLAVCALAGCAIAGAIVPLIRALRIDPITVLKA